MELARIRELSCLSRLKEDSTAVETVYSAVLHGFRERLCAMSGELNLVVCQVEPLWSLLYKQTSIACLCYYSNHYFTYISYDHPAHR